MCVCVGLRALEGGKRNRWVLEGNLGFMDVRFDDGSRKEDGWQALVLRSLGFWF